MQPKSKVSIIIPNYNRAEDILECVESINASNYSNFDIVVVDDCSIDDSADILESKGIRIIRHNKNRGPSAARNTGAKNTDGEFIIFVDSDVVIFKDTIEKFVKIFPGNKKIAAIVGLPGKKSKHKEFFANHFITS